MASDPPQPLASPFFHLQDRTGDRGVVKYLRGDVASDVVDTYTHNWGDRVREVYEANVYSLL